MNFLDAKLPDRFWDKVTPEPNSGCWLWLASLSRGYGAFGVGQHVLRAHQITYSAFVGPVPAGLEIDHKCRTKECCNPAHLEAVTHRVNLLRGDTITARAAAATACPSGHPYDERNTKRERRGRRCRSCVRIYNARQYALRKATQS